MLSELNDIPESLRALALELDELEGPPASGPDDDALPDLDGTDFRPLRLLGRGGMGAVYEAEQLSLGRRVAVKMLDGDIEPRAIARLHHPHIVQVIAAGTVRGRGYFAMELMDGETADNHVFASAPEVVSLGIAISSALAHAHREGLLHRDVKPGNIFRDAAGTAKLGDFGLVQEARDAARPDRSGTARYMAPELSERGEASEKSDQYALGVTLIELLRRNGLSADADLTAVLAKATAYDPSARYNQIEDFETDLREYLRGAPVRARPPHLPRRLVMWSRRNPIAAACTLAALLAVLGAGAYGLLAHAQTAQAERSAIAARQSATEARKSAEEATTEAQRLRSSMGKILYHRQQERSRRQRNARDDRHSQPSRSSER